MALLSGRAGLGFDFSEESGYQDVFLGCDCDKGVMDLAKLLGWEVGGVAHEQIQTCIHTTGM